jgi:microcystin-dependent protein
MDAYIGEIRVFLGTYVPKGWLRCEGDVLNVNSFWPLYRVIGNLYGGDAQRFNLPDLRGRVMVGAGQAPSQSKYTVGKPGGQSSSVLTKIPPHGHEMNGANVAAGDKSPAGNMFAKMNSREGYYGTSLAVVNTKLKSGAILPAGKSAPISIEQTSVALRYIICVDGYAPF